MHPVYFALLLVFYCALFTMGTSTNYLQLVTQTVISSYKVFRVHFQMEIWVIQTYLTKDFPSIRLFIQGVVGGLQFLLECRQSSWFPH